MTVELLAQLLVRPWLAGPLAMGVGGAVFLAGLVNPFIRRGE